MADKSPENHSDDSPDEELGQPTYDELIDEIAESPAVGEPPEPKTPPEIYTVPPPPSGSSAEASHQRQQRLIPVLQLALRDRRIDEVLPQLSPEHKRFLELRFDLASGRRLNSHAKIAEILGLDKEQVARLEAEVLDEVSYLANLPPGANE